MTRYQLVEQLLADFEGAIRLRERWARGELALEGVEDDAAVASLTVRIAGPRNRLLGIVRELVPLREVDAQAMREAMPRRPSPARL